MYFFGAWAYWRYHVLYISERVFESGGRIWDNVFVYICVCLFVMEFFTGKPPLMLLHPPSCCCISHTRHPS